MPRLSRSLGASRTFEIVRGIIGWSPNRDQLPTVGAEFVQVLLEHKCLASERNVRFFSHAWIICSRKICRTWTSNREVFPLLNTRVGGFGFFLPHSFDYDNGQQSKTKHDCYRPD